jgi:hypothetical protein
MPHEMNAQGNPVESLARELWEAYATRNQQVINFPTLHWDECDAFTEETWRMLGRVALAANTSKG